MKDIGVLADIHGNDTALERCMTYAAERGIDTFLFLGDYIGELAYPERTMAMLQDIRARYDCTFIRGNKENYWIDYRTSGGGDWEDNNSTTGMLLYAYSHLSDEDIDFFESLPIKQRIEISGYQPFMICHGSPDRVSEKMVPGSERLRQILEDMDTELIISGHTHRQGQETHHGNVFLNPGSVGIPCLSGGKTQFLILHGGKEGWKEEFVSLEYNVDKVISDMRAERLDFHAPYWNYVTERLLKDGKISNGTVLNQAMALCEAEQGKCVWPHIPEEYWARAVKEIYR